MKILNLTGGWNLMEAGEDVTNMNIKNALPAESYDHIVARHSMPVLYVDEILPKLKEMVDHLNKNGRLHIVTPCFEWAAGLAFKSEVPPSFYFTLYGSKEYPYHSCYTIQWLRDTLEALGLVIREAKTTTAVVRDGDKDYQTLENHIIGIKYHDPDPLD